MVASEMYPGNKCMGTGWKCDDTVVAERDIVVITGTLNNRVIDIGSFQDYDERNSNARPRYDPYNFSVEVSWQYDIILLWKHPGPKLTLHVIL